MMSPLGNLWENSKSAKESNCDVPKWLIESVPCSFPSDVITMSPASKLKMSVPEMSQNGTFGMCSSLQPQCTTLYKLGKLWENAGNILNVPGFLVSLIFPYNVPKVSPIYTKVVYCGHNDGYITNVPLWDISGTPPCLFGFYWLGTLWSHHWGNCKEHFEWATQEHHISFLWQIWDFPTNFQWGHCSHMTWDTECTDHCQGHSAPCVS